MSEAVSSMPESSNDRGSARESPGVDSDSIGSHVTEGSNDDLVSLSRIRRGAGRWMQHSFMGRLFGGPPSHLKAVAFGTASILLAVWSLNVLTTGDETFASGCFVALILALVAFENLRRLRSRLGPNRPLPRAIYCPSCATTIMLSEVERRSMSFRCSACGEEFEVEDDFDQST